MLKEFRTQRIIWDTANARLFEPIQAVEGDQQGRRLEVQLINKGEVVDLSGTSLALAWKTRDELNKGLEGFEVVDSEKGIFELYYPTGMLAHKGRLTASLAFYDDNGRIESREFQVFVQPSVIDDEAVESSDSFTALTQAIVQINEFDGRIEETNRQLAQTEAKKADKTYVEEKVDELEQKDDSLNTQLAQKAIKGEIGLVDMNKNITQFDETWMTDEFKQQMAGTTPVNATPPDKGVTSEKLADKVIYDRHLSTDIVTNTSANLFTEDNAEHGYRLNTSGLKIADPLWMLSEFIPINSGDVVTLLTSDQTSTSVQCQRVALYNDDYSFNRLVSELISTTSDKTTTTINIDGYIKVPSQKNDTQISLTRNLDIDSVEPFQRNFKPKFVFNPQEKMVKTEHIGYEEVNELNTNFIEPVKNLYNSQDPNVLKGYIQGASGVPLVSAPYDTSGFIWIKKDVTYSFTSMRNYKLFNKHRNYINGSFYQFQGHTGNTVTPDEDCYIRFSHTNSDPVQMEAGAVSTSYTPYQYKLRDDIQTSVNSSQLIVNPLYNKRILFNGDSITRASHYPESGWPRLIGTNNSMDWVNEGADGKTIAKTDDIRNSVVNDIQTMSDSADYIILQGGVNDLGLGVPLGQITSGFNDDYDEYTFAGAFESMLRQSILKWKGKKIGFIVTFKATNNYQQYEPYFEIARNACEKWSVPYLDLYKASGLTLQLDEIANEYTTDGDRKHPNEKGYEVITPKIEAWLRTL